MKQNYWKIGILLLGAVLLTLVATAQRVPEWIEYVYSRRFYPAYIHVPKSIFGWIPFSMGDLLYAFLFIGLLTLPVAVLIAFLRRQWQRGWQRVWMGVGVVLGLYLIFHLVWAFNYYRIPLKDQWGLDVDTVLLEDHLKILDQHILIANQLRDQFDPSEASRPEAIRAVEQLMASQNFSGLLTRTQVRIKRPILGSWVSYFGVAGYFNPFTGEAHVNMDMPLVSFPFTVAHELAHQMGLGLEDECNFMAFIRLKDHPDPWFAYAAYFESVNYLLRSLYWVDKDRFDEYREKLTEPVQQDIRLQQTYWTQYAGWISDLSGLFYNQYLKHNNQLDGMARYGMVSRLIIASEKKSEAGRRPAQE